MSREKQFDQLLAFKGPRKYAFFEGKIIYLYPDLSVKKVWGLWKYIV